MALAIFDTELRYLAVSPTYLSDIAWLTSADTFAPADVIGRSVYDTFPKFPECWREIHSRVLAGEKLSAQEELVRRQNGEIEWVRWSAKPWHTTGSRIGGVLVFGEIVTEEIKAKHALAESEERFRATFENAAVGIVHLGPNLRHLRANNALSGIVGWPVDEFVTKSVLDVTHPDDVADDVAHIEQMRRGDIDQDNREKRYLRKDGSITWTRVTTSCVRRRDGSIDYFVRVIQDISKRKRAEQELQRQAALIDQSHDAIFTWKISGGISYWSRGAEVLYGYSREEAIGRCSHDLLQTRARVSMKDLETQIAQQGSWYGELTHTTRDGREIVVESRHVRVDYDGALYALETNRDITERKNAEQRIQLLMRESRHRIKNILGLVQAIARQTAAGDYGNFVDRFTERLQALSANQDLLGRDQQLGAEVEKLVCAQLAHFADLFGSRIAVGGPKLCLNAAAAQAIGLVLHELATNAGKYGALSTDAGRVDVSWQSERDVFTMSWTESDGPLLQPPKSRGFGSTVIDSMAKLATDGEVQLDYAPSGLVWRLRCPAANALETPT